MIFNPPLSRLSVLLLINAGLLLTVAGLVRRRQVATPVADWFLVLLATDAAWALTSIIPLEAGLAPVAFAGQVSSVVASNIAALAWFIFSLVYKGGGATF